MAWFSIFDSCELTGPDPHPLSVGKWPHSHLRSDPGHHGPGWLHGRRLLHHVWREGGREEVFHMQNGMFCTVPYCLYTFKMCNSADACCWNIYSNVHCYTPHRWLLHNQEHDDDVGNRFIVEFVGQWYRSRCVCVVTAGFTCAHLFLNARCKSCATSPSPRVQSVWLGPGEAAQTSHHQHTHNVFNEQVGDGAS